MKIKNTIKKINNFINKYQISLLSSSTSFYMMIAIFSLSVLILQFYNYFNNNNLIINYIIEIINPYYLDSLEEIMPVYSLSGFSIILLLNLIWSSSKFINGFNKASDIIYLMEKKRNFIRNRISSIFIFLVILLVIFIEFITFKYANIVINIIFNNFYIYMFIHFIIELILIYSIIIIINLYVPPVRMKFNQIYYGSFITTFIIYILLVCFIVTMKLYELFNNNFNIISIISLSFLFLYFINYSIIIGIYINYFLRE